MARLIAEPGTVGSAFRIGDIAVGTVLSYLAVRFAECELGDRDRLEERPSFAMSRPVPRTITEADV